MDLSTILILGGLISFLFLVIGIVLYVLMAVGLYGLAKTEGIGNEWFAFIPILQLYIIGKILKEIRISTYTIPSLELVLPITPIAVYIVDKVFNVIPAIGGLLSFILSLAYLAFTLIVLYNFYNRYKGGQATLMTVLSIIPFMAPIYIYTLRNSKPL